MADTKNPEKVQVEQIMKQAQKLQKQMQWMQHQLDAEEIIGEAGGGMIKAVLNGRYRVKKITADPALANEKIDAILEMVALAINDGIVKVEKHSQGKLQNMFAQMGAELPPEG
jgi:nucleoid-associated protein EbfC